MSARDSASSPCHGCSDSRYYPSKRMDIGLRGIVRQRSIALARIIERDDTLGCRRLGRTPEARMPGVHTTTPMLE